MRRAARIDSTHRAIVEALEAVGCDVLDLSRVGHGCPDLLVRFRGVLTLIEVKGPKGKLNPQQQAFRQRWPDVQVVRTPDEALKIMLASKHDAVYTVSQR